MDELLTEAAAASPNDRIRWRDPICAHGEAALDRVVAWLQDRRLASFAVRVIECIGLDGNEESAEQVLRVAASAAPSLGIARDISQALERLQAAGRPASQTERGASGALVYGMPIADRPFAPPLTDNERELIGRFKEGLSDGWEIFVRPHLDGDRPALALLHARRGAMVWDIRDWDLADHRFDDAGGWQRYRDGEWSDGVDPIKQLNRVRQRIYAEYVPDYGEAIDQRSQLYGVVRAGVYFPQAASAQLGRLDLTGRDEVVVGADALRQPIGRLVPNASRSVDIEPRWHDVLRRRFANFHPPTFGGVRPNARQRELIADEPRSGVWAIEGVAGSGKSLVLARRAARLAAKGRRVLLVTYNITLANYCRGLVDDAPNRFDRSMLVVQHAHGLCSAILRRLDERGPAQSPARDIAVDKEEAVDEAVEHEADDRRYDVEWPEWTSKVIDRGQLPDDFRFDVILVDEAQDLSASFIDLLQRCLRSDGELLFAYDRAQRLYARTDVTMGRRLNDLVRGTRRLDTGYRLSREIATLANSLARAAALQTEPIVIDVSQQGLFGGGTIRWIETSNDAESCADVTALLKRFRQEDGYRPDSTAVLVSKVTGPVLVRLLEEHDIDVNAVFPLLSQVDAGSGRRDWQLLARSHKATFVPHDQRTKVSTVHSFKGWEAERVVVVLPEGKAPLATSPSSAPVLYVAITRTMRHLILVGPRDRFGLRETVETEAMTLDHDMLARAKVLVAASRAANPPSRPARLRPSQHVAQNRQSETVRSEIDDEEWDSVWKG